MKFPSSGDSLSSLCTVAGTTMMRTTTETTTTGAGTIGTTETDTTRTGTLIGGSGDGAELDMTIVGGETRLGLE